MYIDFHQIVNFKSYLQEDVEVALKNDLYDVVIYNDKLPVAMGRIVGDDRIVFFLKDIIVHPDFQGKGIGSMLMNQLFKYIEEKACDGAYIGLMSTPKMEKFYQRFGFIERPTDGLGSGMVMYYEK